MDVTLGFRLAKSSSSKSTAIDAGCIPEASNNEIADLNGSLASLTNELVSSLTGVIESFSKQDAFSLKFVPYET